MPIELLSRSALAVGVVLGGAGVSILAIETIRSRPLSSSSLMQRWLTWLVLAAVWLFTLASPIVLRRLFIVGGQMCESWAPIARQSDSNTMHKKNRGSWID